MQRQDPDMAECFVYYLSEQGVDVSGGLSDDRHKNLIRRQWEQFTQAMDDGVR